MADTCVEIVCQFDELRHNDRKLLSEYAGDRLLDDCKQRFGNDKCVVVRICGSIAGVGWISGFSQGAQLLNKRDACLIRSCVTLPAHRRKGVYSCLLTAAVLECHPLPVFVMSHFTNFASLRAIRKVGFVRVGALHRCLGKEWVTQKRKALRKAFDGC
jgi:hypothetical protein